MERIIKFTFSTSRVGWERRDDELLHQFKLVKMTHPYNDISSLTTFIANDLEQEKGSDAREMTTELIRLSLLHRGLAVPFLKFRICSAKHMWPSQHGACVPPGICCQKNKTFCYMLKILPTMQQFRTKFLSE
jgi:hypothetical protein